MVTFANLTSPFSLFAAFSNSGASFLQWPHLEEVRKIYLKCHSKSMKRQKNIYLKKSHLL